MSPSTNKTRKSESWKLQNRVLSASTPLFKLERRMSDFFTEQRGDTTGLLILLRGLPGSGKSKLANYLQSRYAATTVVVKLDDHLTNWRPGTSLSPGSSILADAYAACKQAAWSAMQSGVRFIIIDNENLRYSDMMAYVSEAIKTNYEVHFIEPATSWRYSARALARRNRRGLTEEQLQDLLDHFEQFCTADDFVAELRRRKGTSYKSSKTLISCAHQLDDPAIVDPQAPSRTIPTENVNPDVLSTNLLKSLCLHETAETSGSASPLPATLSATEAVARLHEMFPLLQLPYLEELVRLTEGDLVYAAALVAENEEQLILPNASSDSVEPPISQLDSKKEEKTPLADAVNETALLFGEVPLQEGDAEASAEICQPEEAPLIHLSPRFLKSTFNAFEAELHLPKLELDFDEMPVEVFDEWVPEENISKQILVSFLNQLGCLRGDGKSDGSSRSSKFRSLKSRISTEVTSNHIPVGSNVPNLEGIMAEESAIRLSVLEQKKHFEKPYCRRALRRLVEEYPGTDPEILMETLVRCGFDFDTAMACLVAGVLDLTTFIAAADTSEFRPLTSSAAVSSHTPSPESTSYAACSPGAHRLADVLEAGDAHRRSLADKSKSKQTMAVRLRFRRLADQFPSFGKPYLAEIFAQFDFDEDMTRQHLEAQGYKANPVSPLLASSTSDETDEVSSSSPSYTSVEIAQSLNLLEAEVAELRRNIEQMKATLTKAHQSRVHPGVEAFYRDELREMRLQLEYRLSLYSDLRVTLSSQQQAAKRAGENQEPDIRDPRWRARQWLAYLDLHGLDLRHAMRALRQRLQLLESGVAAPGLLLPSGVATSPAALGAGASLPNHWLPKRLTVITGWGSSSSCLGVRKPTSTLRHNVINFLRSAAYDFEETPHLGSGHFEVRLGAKQRRS